MAGPQGYQLDESLLLIKSVLDNVLLEHGWLIVFFLSLSTLSWDTFLTLRGTWGFYNHYVLWVGRVGGGPWEFSESPGAKLSSPFFIWLLLAILGFEFGLDLASTWQNLRADIYQMKFNFMDKQSDRHLDICPSRAASSQLKTFHTF